MFGKYNIYDTKYFLYQYNDFSFRIVKQKYSREKGFESDFVTKCAKYVDKEDINRQVLSRAKRNIREIALCNDFEYFCTFTVNKNICDRYNIDVCEENMRYLLSEYKRKNKDLKYLFIAESHKDGAYHFHGLLKGINKNDLYKNQNGYFSHKYFDKLGFNSFSIIKNYEKCCNYITKYITKNCVKNSKNSIYFCSKGLKRASRSEIKPIENIYTYENDFCSIRDFNLNNLTKEEKFYFFSNIVDK